MAAKNKSLARSSKSRVRGRDTNKASPQPRLSLTLTVVTAAPPHRRHPQRAGQPLISVSGGPDA
jgi:hypothetical protein